MKKISFAIVLLSFIFFMAFSSCGHKGGHEGHDHEEHEHHEADGNHHYGEDHEEQDGHSHNEVLSLTGYGDKFEIFVEAQPFSIGNESHLLAHITLLDSFKPLGEGKVTLTMNVGGKSVNAVADKPEHPGVYKFEITPPATGAATLVFNIETPNGKVTQLIDGITVYKDEHTAHHEASQAKPHVSNGATFTKEMSWKINYSTNVATLKPFGEIIKTTGRIEPSAGDVETLVARVSGTLHFISPTLSSGSTVTAGQQLFRINPEVMTDGSLKVKLREAESNYNIAKDAYERGKKLKEDGLMAEGELVQLKNAYESAESAYRHLNSNIKGGQTGVSSPLSGYLTTLDVANGQYVEAGQVLGTVARNKDLLVRAEVPVRFARRLKGIESASMRPMNETEYVEIMSEGGGVVSIGKSVNGDSQRVPVIMRLPNRAAFIPGEFVDMRIRTAGNEDALVVPSSALIEQQGAWFVFVQITPEYFEKRSVKPGRSDGTETEILDGLKEGERVVGRGAIMVKLAQASGALDAHAGHMH